MPKIALELPHRQSVKCVMLMESLRMATFGGKQIRSQQTSGWQLNGNTQTLWLWAWCSWPSWLCSWSCLQSPVCSCSSLHSPWLWL